MARTFPHFSTRLGLSLLSIYPIKPRVLCYGRRSGRRSTAYFLRQERVRGQQKLINAIRQSDGTVVSSTNDVLGVWRDFYFRLFLSQELSEVDQRLFLDSIERRLMSNESKLCEGDLTIEECSKALSNMPSAKSPGVDGLPAEFYRRFWTLLGPDLVEVRLLLDVACYADQNNIGGAIVSLDQEKAFDRVEFSFMMKVLECMGFGPSFRHWIGLLYTDVHSAVSVNGFLTEFFPVTRGVRQGCPLSPLLYVLVMQLLASAVRADIHIDGFPLLGGNNVVKILQ